MSLISHWKSRKKWLGVRTRGRPLWWLVLMLLIVFIIMHLLDRAAEIVSEHSNTPRQPPVEQNE